MTDIPLEDCVVGHWYRIRSRNLQTGVYKGQGWFIGRRHKFDSVFLDSELYGHSLTRVEEDLGPCPVTVLQESLGSRCGICGVPAEYQYFPGGKRMKTLSDGSQMEVPGEWVHLELTDCAEPEPHSVSNTELFEWLDEHDKSLREEPGV